MTWAIWILAGVVAWCAWEVRALRRERRPQEPQTAARRVPVKPRG